MRKYINPCELTAAVTAVANIIARDLPDDELNLLAAMLVQLGDTLATISVVRDINANTVKKSEEKAVNSD